MRKILTKHIITQFCLVTVAKPYGTMTSRTITDIRALNDNDILKDEIANETDLHTNTLAQPMHNLCILVCEILIFSVNYSEGQR